MKKIIAVLKSIHGSGELNDDVLEGLTKSEREIVDALYRQNLISEALDFSKNLDLEEEWAQLVQKLATSKKQKVSFWNPLLKYAAIFVGLISISYLVYQQKNVEIEMPITETAIKLKTDGSHIKVIREGESEQIVSASGKVLGVQNGNKISYKTDSKINELVYNELEIPYGKVFDVELSDGTLVHLNSGTKMRYPVKFLNDGKREVFIEGEAYFKVAKDKKHPFVVYADEVEVEVLGTEFNLSSYKEDSEIKTVLVEGSVRMTNSFKPQENKMLVPGTKGAWNRTSHNTTTTNVDVNLYAGWINGGLVFKNTSFASMIKKLERSYNVVIENNNVSLANKILNARFNVHIESIEEVLKSINEIHPFNYSKQGRKIVIN